MNRDYHELIKIKSFLERFNYLKIGGTVGKDTFGFDRYLNQILYRSYEWKKIRDSVIERDLGFDLAHQDIPIIGRIVVHHMNPITTDDILSKRNSILDPSFLVSCSFSTHLAIHYGDSNLLPKDYFERKSGDTTLW